MMTDWKAENIRLLRLRLGWSQADLALRLGCAPSLVHSWETRESFPNQDSIDILDRLLNQIDQYSAQITYQPLAETYLRQEGLAQISSVFVKKNSI